MADQQQQQQQQQQQSVDEIIAGARAAMYEVEMFLADLHARQPHAILDLADATIHPWAEKAGILECQIHKARHLMRQVPEVGA